MMTRTAIAAVVMASAVASGSAVALNSTPANASTASATAKTCAAFARWDHHRTTANLNAMLTASELAPWVLVGTDAVVVYTDVRSKQNVTDDVKSFRTDCAHRR
jgi:hypothetical protein